MQHLTILAAAMALAAVLGFAAHKAGICMVKAVAEMMTSQRPYMLLAFAKTSAWSFLAIVMAAWVGDGATYQRWPMAWPEVAGGVVFGIGAAVNGGCVFSTLSRLADGRAGALAAVSMWPAGALIATTWLGSIGYLVVPEQTGSSDLKHEVSWLLIAGLGAWATLELWRIGFRMWKRPASSGLGPRLLTLSSAAALIGLSNGYIYRHFQSWSFTSAVMRSISGTHPERCSGSMPYGFCLQRHFLEC